MYIAKQQPTPAPNYPTAPSGHEVGGPIADLHDELAQRLSRPDPRFPAWHVDAQLPTRKRGKIRRPHLLAAAGGIVVGASIVATLLT